MGYIYKSVLIFLFSFSALFAQEKQYLNQAEALEVRSYIDKITEKKDSITLFSDYKEYLQDLCVQYVREAKSDSAQMCVDLISKIDPKLDYLRTDYSILETSLASTIGKLHDKYNLIVDKYKLDVEWTDFGGVYFFIKKES